MVTLGSMTACSSIGSNTSHPKALPTPEVAKTAPDGSWELWSTLANSDSNPQFWREFGTPTNFYSRVEESNWLSFTVTLKDPSFIERYETWSGDKAGTGALCLVNEHSCPPSAAFPQPNSRNPSLLGLWAFPAHTGDFVKKPMSECSGEEILKELLGHLKFPEQPTLNTSITIPSMLPYITSQFLTQNIGDRPLVIPKGSTNLALLGQYVEILEDTVFTVEYSVRAAQIAVHELMGTKRNPRSIYKGAHNVKVLADALRMLLT
ncbi:Oleate hydratase [Lachnellula hyalina]|uniref:Oleate hydratase n=1 Tax=Lachnellula hyalina TaxID=1316788 RepID=A0A8H8R586_9HELO|nr:Oleate hydratase [Lachnellula hyalina]TVY28768.1 Oleate hydratase [Lachnellula hyalina]